MVVKKGGLRINLSEEVDNKNASKFMFDTDVNISGKADDPLVELCKECKLTISGNNTGKFGGQIYIIDMKMHLDKNAKISIEEDLLDG